MRTVTMSWQPEAGRFEAIGGHEGFPVAINAPHPGDASGFSPADLLLAAAGSCSAWDVVEILRKARQPLEGLEVQVGGVQDEASPHAFRDVELVYVARGAGLDRRQVERAVQLSVDRYCAVIATIRGVAKIATRVEVDEASPATS
jgi:putative redox protein